MKIAICVSGTTKNHQNSLASIEKFFAGHDVDIFIHTYDNVNPLKLIEDCWSKNTAYHYYKDLKLSTKEIVSLFNPKSYIIDNYDETRPIFERNLSTMLIEGVKAYNEKNITPRCISMHYSIRCSDVLRQLHEQEHGFKYDCVVRIRFDSEIVKMDDLSSYDLTKINIPVKRDWEGGINDQFAFGHPDKIATYSNMYPMIIFFAKIVGVYHPETIFKKYLETVELLDQIVRPDMLVEISSDIDYSEHR